jgi:hypothetical protein
MVETTLNRMLYCLFVFALFCGTSFAQSAAPAIAHTTHSGIVTPAQPTPATLKTIFTNLGPSKTDDYNDTAGLYIMGPTNSFGDSEQADAVPFTPKSNSHVTQLQVAVGWISGTKKVVVGLYSDASGTAGTLLASGSSTSIPDFGACCTLVVVTIPSTAVTAGTQYWIGASTDDTNAPDFAGVFEASNNATTSADVGLTGWFAFSNIWPAAAAFGTTP